MRYLLILVSLFLVKKSYAVFEFNNTIDFLQRLDNEIKIEKSHCLNESIINYHQKINFYRFLFNNPYLRNKNFNQPTSSDIRLFHSKATSITDPLAKWIYDRLKTFIEKYYKREGQEYFLVLQKEQEIFFENQLSLIQPLVFLFIDKNSEQINQLLNKILKQYVSYINYEMSHFNQVYCTDYVIKSINTTASSEIKDRPEKSQLKENQNDKKSDNGLKSIEIDKEILIEQKIKEIESEKPVKWRPKE